MTSSMTAFGRAQRSFDDRIITAEIRSVNNRYLDCTAKLPRAYGFLEEKIKPYIQSRGISRGKVDVFVSVDMTSSSGALVTLDEAYAESYIEALKQLRDKFGLHDDMSLMRVASNRDLFIVQKPDDDEEKDWEQLKSALDGALDVFMAARAAEGENLKNDILKKRDRLRGMKDEIAARSEKNIREYRTRLETRLRATIADLELKFDDARILTECAIFADRVAIDEELVRLESHFKAMDGIFAAKEPCGRKLDFLVQEMNREINTIGSKSGDADIASIVVEMKNELEKIREQIQNLE